MYKKLCFIMAPLGIYRGYKLAEYNNKSTSIKCQTILLSVFFYLHPATIPFIIRKEVVRVTNKIEAIDFVSLF